jgi:carboxyl-terminal processing protease
MRENQATNLVKGFIFTVLGLVLVLAAFGVGMTVGVHSQGAASVAVFPSRPILLTPAEGALHQGGADAAEPAALATPPAKPAALPSSKSPLDRALFDEAWGLLQSQFYGDLPTGKDVTYDAIRGVVDQLGDQHTAFIDPEHAALFNADMDGHFEGIGARVDLAEDGGVEVTYLFSDQPAEKAGLRVGDVIMKVDGQDVTQMDLTEAISLIRGPRGTEVVLTIKRGEEALQDIKVIRDRVEIPVVDTKTLGNGRIGYVALSEFSSVAPQRLAEAVKETLAKKPAGLILDLRGNPGGLLDAAVRIGSYFVPNGNILIERGKDGTERTYQRNGSYLIGNTPLVVLVDGGSASASEIVAGAIQDAGTGVLIGEKTYGKGSVQLPNTLSDGSQLRVTIAHWFTPKNREIHGVGLAPDVVVPFTEEDAAAQRDPQLDRAVEYLLNGK